MAHHLPLVSVIIPVYNGTLLVREAIASVLDQTYDNLEVLVVDDGSEDIQELARIVAECPPKVRLFRQLHAGVAAALNRGVAEMSGELFSWLSHDDLYHPRKLAREVRQYIQGKGPSVIYSDYCYIDSRRRISEFVRIPILPGRSAWELLITHTWLHGCAMLIPKSGIIAAGGFDTGLKTTQDYDLFFRLAQHMPFLHVPEVLAAVRIHQGQTTQTSKPLVFAEQDQLYSRYIGADNPADPCKLYRHLHRRFTVGLLPGAAGAARRRAFAAARTSMDWVKTSGSAAIFNGMTAPFVRSLLLRRNAPRGTDIGWDTYTAGMSASAGTHDVR